MKKNLTVIGILLIAAAAAMLAYSILLPAGGNKTDFPEKRNTPGLTLERCSYGPFRCGGEFDMDLAKKHFGEIEWMKTFGIEKDGEGRLLTYEITPETKNKKGYLYCRHIRFKDIFFKVTGNKIDMINTGSDLFDTGANLKIGDGLQKLTAQYGEGEMSGRPSEDGNFLDYSNRENSLFLSMGVVIGKEDRIENICFMVFGLESDEEIYALKTDPEKVL